MSFCRKELRQGVPLPLPPLPPLPGAAAQHTLYALPLPGPRSKYRLDVLPFLVLYALWGCFVVETLATSGVERWMIIQLGTYALLAAHVRPLCLCQHRDGEMLSINPVVQQGDRSRGMVLAEDQR